MKKLKLLACLLALAAVAGTALAGQSGVSLGLGVQYWDAKDADVLDEDGLLGGGAILRLRATDYIGVDFRAGAVGIWDSDTYRRDGTKYETDAVFYCVPLEVGLVLMLPLNDVLTIYGGPGVGYYYYDIDVETTTKHGHHSHSEWSRHIKMEDDFGWFAVAGLNIRLAPGFSIFGEVRYTETETSLKGNDAAKIDCSGIGGQAGIMFGF